MLESVKIGAVQGSSPVPPGDTRWDSTLLMFESVIGQIYHINLALEIYKRANPTLHPPTGFSQSLPEDISQIMQPLYLLRDITKQGTIPRTSIYCINSPIIFNQTRETSHDPMKFY